MNKLAILSILAAVALCGCSTHSGVSTKNPLCAGIVQKVNQAPNKNTYPGSGVTTAADRAHLMKQYNQLGCHRASDNTYRNSWESLPMNDMANRYGDVTAPRH